MDSHKAVIQEWLTKSENDFKNLSEFIEENRPYQADLACFCAQQSIEKLLKAVLVLHKQKFTKIHDLDELAAMVQSFVKEWSVDPKALEKLTTLGIAARYPGISVTPNDLQTAYQLCVSIREKLLPLFQGLTETP